MNLRSLIPRLSRSGQAVVIAPTAPPSAMSGHTMMKYCHALRCSTHRLMWSLCRIRTLSPCPRRPPCKRVMGIEPALSAWELDCHVSLTTAPQVSRRPRLSVGTRQVPLLTLPSGTQRARCQVRTNAFDRFCVREPCRSRLLSHLGNDLRRMVRTRPLVSVAVSGDRYSVGYSVAREHVVSDSRLRRQLAARSATCTDGERTRRLVHIWSADTQVLPSRQVATDATARCTPRR